MVWHLNGGAVTASVPHDSLLGPLFFFAYINDITDNLKCNFKLFADDVSLFTTVYDQIQAASDINYDFDMDKDWSHKWRMSIDPVPTKRTIEVTLARKKL